jgi:LysM repeat protein
MKLRIVFYSVFLLILVGCGAKKKLVENKKNNGVVLLEPKPEELPSVNENKHIKKLKNTKKTLNNNVLKYIEDYAAIAVEEMQHHKIPASITLAQGILESGSGKSQLASKSNNHFGIKCHSGWKGERVYHDDDTRGECFRKYQYVATSYKDHSAFLSKRKRYAFLFNYDSKDYKRWARGLKKAGYATDKKYPNKLISIIETYKLNEFDKVKKKAVKIKESADKIEKPAYTIGNYYQVEKGDTLYSIAKKFETTVAILKEINGLKENIISIGQHLLTK